MRATAERPRQVLQVRQFDGVFGVLDDVGHPGSRLSDVIREGAVHRCEARREYQTIKLSRFELFQNCGDSGPFIG